MYCRSAKRAGGVSQVFKPRDYQRAIVGHILNVPRCNVWAGMGTGKTVSTLTALQGLHGPMGEDGQTLVLAPKRVATSTWPGELKKWMHLSGLQIAVAVGVEETRKAALRRDVPVVVTNYDNLLWLREYFDEKGRAWPFTTVVSDESVRLKSFRIKQGGVRAQALAAVAHKDVKRWINLTGAPSPNGLHDLWGQAWFLDEGRRLGRSFSAFDDRWFVTKRRQGQDFGGEVIALPGAKEAIENRLADLTLTIRASDYFDLPPLIENTIEVELPASARRHYSEMERKLFTVLKGGHEVEAFSAAAKSMKCLQCANGAMYLDPDRYPPKGGEQQWIEVHDAKLEAMESIVAEAAGMPVLVAYHFKSDLARLRRAFPKARVLDDDPGTVDEWNAGRIPILLAHPGSAGHGLNLQDGGNILVFFGLNWNLDQHEQMIERVGPTRQAQSGHDRPCFVHYIVAKDTVDEAVVQRLKTKASVQASLLEAMAARGFTP